MVDEIYKWVLEIGEAAAKMTRTRFEAKLQRAVYNALPNRTIAELATKNMRQIGAPTYNDEEKEFARKLGEQISPEDRRQWAYRVPGHENLPADVYIDSRIVIHGVKESWMQARQTRQT